MLPLFEPLSVRGIVLKNRIAVSPMCEYSSTDGFANDWHLVHLGSRAVGGAGLVITEAAAVTPGGRITQHDLGIWRDDHVTYLKRICDFIVSQESVPAIQLAHAGRKASHHRPWDGGKALTAGEGAWQTLAPTAIPFHEAEPAPKAMSKEEIRILIEDFTSATRRAVNAGFQIIEIHAAHGYLLNEFLSPLSNHRTDEYGGSFDNRARLLLEIIKACRSVMSDTMPLFVRISATDWVQGGFNENDAVELSILMKANGVDLVDCSSGGVSPLQKIPVAPLYQVSFAEKIKREARMFSGAVGLITTAKQANEIIATQQADLVILARQFLRDPYFPLHAASELGVEVSWPVQYERAKIKPR